MSEQKRLVAGLRRIQHTMATKWEDYGVDVLAASVARLESLDALCREALEALEPFAETWESDLAAPARADSEAARCMWFSVSGADLRRAAALVAKLKGE